MEENYFNIKFYLLRNLCKEKAIDLVHFKSQDRHVHKSFLNGSYF